VGEHLAIFNMKININRITCDNILLYYKSYKFFKGNTIDNRTGFRYNSINLVIFDKYILQILYNKRNINEYKNKKVT